MCWGESHASLGRVVSRGVPQAAACALHMHPCGSGCACPCALALPPLRPGCAAAGPALLLLIEPADTNIHPSITFVVFGGQVGPISLETATTGVNQLGIYSLLEKPSLHWQNHSWRAKALPMAFAQHLSSSVSVSRYLICHLCLIPPEVFNQLTTPNHTICVYNHTLYTYIYIYNIHAIPHK